MTRPLRIDRENGWYHITARGQNRGRIYKDLRDREHFLELVEELTKRFEVEVHAFVLMDNHYHLLIRTPRANASPALQWLNQSYSLWWNRRHHRCGHVFQGRFKSVLVEEGGWVLALSFYLHFNPVAVKDLGWGKSGKRLEGKGYLAPSAEVIAQRLEVLRTHRWSSYRSYAGYEKAPKWLRMEEILGRVRGGKAGYRKEAESRLGQEGKESLKARLKWGAVLGSEAFAEQVRDRLKVYRETHARQALRLRTNWSAVVGAVEKIKGERWNQFSQQHGDWGRDLCFWIARRRGGLTLKELADKAQIDYSAVSEALRYYERRKRMKPDIRRAEKAVAEFLNLEM